MTNFEHLNDSEHLVADMFPYVSEFDVSINGEVTLENIEKNKRILLNKVKDNLTKDEIKKLNCFSMKDINLDSLEYRNDKIVNIGFDSKDSYVERVNNFKEIVFDNESYCRNDRVHNMKKDFDFDFQPKLEGHPGPSPSVILQVI